MRIVSVLNNDNTISTDYMSHDGCMSSKFIQDAVWCCIFDTNSSSYQVGTQFQAIDSEVPVPSDWRFKLVGHPPTPLDRLLLANARKDWDAK